MDERVRELLLDEMRALDAYRQQYLRAHPGLRIDREDPELRLLLEALAFSAVRTRLATQQGQEALWRRLFASEFDYLLRPQPAMAMVRAEITAALVETFDLPRGSRLRIQTVDGALADFETLEPLRVVPVTLARVELQLRRGGYRLVLGFESQFLRPDPPGLVRLHINYLDDYAAAERIKYALQLHLQRAFVAYDTPIGEHSDGPTCSVTFGAMGHAAGDDRNPIEKVRDFWHYPERELFLNIQVAPPRRAYTRFALCLDLDPHFPDDPPLHPDVFVPLAVPIRNTRRDYSRPMLCDGTREEYPVTHVLDERSLFLWRALGVYELLPNGMVPLPPAALGVAGDSYELDERVQFAESGAASRSMMLRAILPDSLVQARQLVVDGLWHQPGFGHAVNGPLQIRPAEQTLPGLLFKLAGPIRPAQPSAIAGHPEALLELLALKMRSSLTLAELRALLAAIGGLRGSAYKPYLSLLGELAAEVTKDGSARDLGIRHVYRIKLAAYAPEEEPLVHRFLTALRALLDAWNHDAAIGLLVDTSGCPLRLPLNEDAE